MFTRSSPPPFLVFGAPHIGEAEIDEVVATLRSGWLGTGPRVARFEAAFAAYKGVAPAQALGLSSCSAGLHLALLAAGIGPGDEVITTPLTFCATINAILHVGATPVLADIDPLTLNLDPGDVARKLTAKTRALLPVHFAGRGCAMGELLRIAEAHDLRVIEDCAHAIETLIDGKPAGTLGDFGSFSFYATKNLTTGEGGMLLGRDEALLHKSRALSLHGVSKDAFMRREAEQFLPYDVVGAGYKYNMMDLQAALGLHQLAEVGENHKKRAFIWQRYREAIEELPLAGPPALPTGPDRHGLHLFTVQVSPERAGLSRDELAARLRVAGIGTGVHYTSLADFPYYQERCGFHPEQVPHATRVSRHILSLPLSAHLSAEEVTRVIGSLREALMP